jgi:hypothetical protein
MGTVASHTQLVLCEEDPYPWKSHYKSGMPSQSICYNHLNRKHVVDTYTSGADEADGAATAVVVDAALTGVSSSSSGSP